MQSCIGHKFAIKRAQNKGFNNIQTPEFLCDRMCVELGRWLRIAGYDTLIAEDSMEDREIFRMALEENRVLLTRDKDFKKFEGGRIVFLMNDHLEECAIQLKEEMEIDWLYAPFSRCLQCNSVLERTNENKFWICPECKKLFWRGSHTIRMENQLKKWNAQEIDR